ncbi:MAG: metallophosphoesterase family protein [Candidatus Limivicinus sp.]|jgi:exonuclease SbcD
MRKIRILHTADLHLDSPFEGLGPCRAAVRRAEQRQLLDSLAQLAREKAADIVLMSGDLLDSGSSSFETGEELVRSLGNIPAPVFISPGNHDFYSSRSPYARLKMPENVHIFTSDKIECLELPELAVRVCGAAFTDSRSGPLLSGFSAEREAGIFNLLCIHGEVGAPGSAYNPIREEELAASGMDYAALGHIHKASGLLRAGSTWYSWPGCPEGRGFDETGEKYVNITELSEEGCRLEQISIARRHYEILNVDVTDADPLAAVRAALPENTKNDIYRIVLTGETDEAPDLAALRRNLPEAFFELQLRDKTRIRRDIWERAGEDSLIGIFLRKLKEMRDSAGTEDERQKAEQAARWGLAALDNGEEVAVHEDK